MHDCSKPRRLVYLVTALFMAAGVIGCATAESGAPAGPPVQATVQAERTAVPVQVQRPAYQSPGMVTYYPPPDRMDFCGEHVPLENQEVMERFDKEFTLVVYSHAQVYRWLKRRDGYFQWMEERLRRLNLPEDLKYVALAESEPPLSAADRKRWAEMRNDFERSPESALQYLGDLHRSFRSWALALAAYCCGEKRIMDESRAQGQSDFYKMMLPPETERYVFKVLAIKAVLSDPTRYGYELPKGSRQR